MAEAGPTRTLAVLGKGGVGKTVVSALLARALLDFGVQPLLLIDADPAQGLTAATGLDRRASLADVARQTLGDLGESAEDRQSLADRLDYLLLDALSEGDGLGLLAMGAGEGEGCFCPLHRLLRMALGRLSAGFQVTIVDAEAGLEQVHRQVFDQIDLALLVCDGSLRAAGTAEMLAEQLRARSPGPRLGVVLNRCPPAGASLPSALPLCLQVPSDDEVAGRDRRGESLLSLPARAPALAAVRAFVEREGQAWQGS